MNRKIARIAIGYMVILVHEKGAMFQPANCKLADNDLSATCVVVDKVPPNLNGKLQKLHLNGKVLDEINEESFKPYPNLVLLRCEGLMVKKHFADKFIFRPLTSLREVYFYKVDLSESSTFFWPETIQILNITQCLVKSLDLTNAVNLRILSASYNALIDLPIINEFAPIESVDVNFNPLGAVTISSFARLCHVTKIDMYPTSSSTLKTQAAYCTCTAILLWIDEFKITANIRSEETQLVCTVPTGGPIACENRITPAALKVRNDCLTKKAPASNSNWITIVISAAIVSLLMILLFFAYMYGWLRKKERLGEVVEIHHGKEPVPEETVAEEEPLAGGGSQN